MPAVFQKTVEQDLHKPLKIQYCADTVFTKDNAGNLINVLLYEDGEPYNGGGTVSATAIRADGATESWAGTISGNTVSVALTRAALDVPGTLQVFIKVTAGTVETTVYAGVYNVVCTETPTVVAPVTPSDVAALIASIEAAIRNIPADWTSFLGTIAPTFDPAKADGYAAGAYVWYPGQPDNVGTLYRFTSAHSGTWTGTDAVTVVIGNELNDTVRYTAQVHTDEQKTVARANIGAADADDVTDLELTTVQVTPQTFDDNSKSQARSNIGAASSGDLSTLSGLVSQQGGYISDLSAAVGTVPTGETVEGQIGDLKSAIGQVKGEIFNDSINLFDKSKIETGLLNVVGNIATTQTTFRTTDFIPVDYPNSVVIQDDSKVSQDRYYICEYNASKEFIGSRQELLVGLNITYGVYTVAESNAKFIRISYMPQNTPTDTLMIFLGNSKSPTFQPFGALFVKDSFVSQVKTPMAVKIANEKLYVITKYKDGSDLCVGFGKHGGNNLPDFETLGLIQNNDFYPVTDASSSTPFITIATDIHAPYLVKAINNINGDLPDSEHFTGGNHNYNNNAAPGYTPTATCDSLKYYVDGNEVTEYVGYAKSVKAVWVNSVQATNTKKADGTGRSVLKETHTLVFEDGKWHSSVEIVPLEDVLIKTYYGFQWIMNAVYPNIRFIGAVNRGLYTNAQVNTSGNNVVNAMRMFGTEHSTEIDLDTTFDIGNRRFYSGTSGAYNSTVKSYFYLMSNVNANAGDLYCAKADFIFSPA